MSKFAKRSIRIMLCICMIFLIFCYFELQSVSVLLDSLNMYFSNKRLIIIGMANNSEKTLPKILNDLDALKSYFQQVTYIFFESNSNDKTLDLLNSWSLNDLNKIIISGDSIILSKYNMSKLEFNSMIRVSKYSLYRNLLLTLVKERVDNSIVSIENTFLAIIDLDIIQLSNPLSLMLYEWHYSLIHTDIDVLCMNAVRIYKEKKFNNGRDTYSMIDTSDIWYKYPNDRFESICIKYRNSYGPFSLFYQSRFKEMKSCFGGLTFYSNLHLLLNECNYINPTKSNLKRIQYNPAYNKYNVSYVINKLEKAKQNKICEHIPFHLCLGNNGMKIAISTKSKIYFEMNKKK